MWLRIAGNYSTSAVFMHPSVSHRIQSFAALDLSAIAEPQQIVQPDYLVEARAKTILQYVAKNNIPNNVRIIHALAHIEYNAFMSYADTLLRFRHQAHPYRSEFETDMRDVALEEGHHFKLLNARLQALGYRYGSLPVLPKLSLAISQTKHSFMERIAVISLVHEGRGVKAVQKLLGQLKKDKDSQSVSVVNIIKNDESKHFRMGWKWFFRVCKIQNVQPEATIAELNSKFKSDIKLPPDAATCY